MRSERFEFANAKGEKLAAVLDLPLGEPTAYALFAHCFTCGKDNRCAEIVAGRLSGQGIAVLRFDFTGLSMQTPAIPIQAIILAENGRSRTCGINVSRQCESTGTRGQATARLRRLPGTAGAPRPVTSP